MKHLSCCFTGHRIIASVDKPAVIRDLRTMLRNLAASGMQEFICGGALGFDTLAAEEVLSLKKEFPDISLFLVLPCRDQSARWTAKQKETFQSILERADKVECLFEHYVSGCMHMRNRFMVDHADLCIAYYKGKPGGTAYTVQYAKEKGIHLLYIPSKEDSPWEI